MPASRDAAKVSPWPLAEQQGTNVATLSVTDRFRVGNHPRPRPKLQQLTADDGARLAVYLLSDASMPQTGTIIDLEQKVTGAP